MVEVGGEELLPAEIEGLVDGFPTGAAVDDAIGVGGADVEGAVFIACALEEDLETRTVGIFGSG